MILIITHKEDYTADFVINELNKRSISYYRFNCENLHNISLTIDREGGFFPEIDDISSIKSVWFRRTKLPILNDILDNSERIYVLGEYDALLSNLFQLLNDKKWLSHPDKVYRAENKLYQLKIAGSIGFKIPDTITSGNHEKVKGFINKHDEVIIKPLSQGRITNDEGVRTIFTNKLNKSTIENLDGFLLTPSIIQEYIEKEYEIRVTVVNGKIYSAKVDSQSYKANEVDWRKEKIPFKAFELPKQINEKIRSLLTELELNFGAIDLIKSKSGEYIFLEINPNGQWAWLEMELGLPISNEIINFLSN